MALPMMMTWTMTVAATTETSEVVTMLTMEWAAVWVVAAGALHLLAGSGGDPHSSAGDVCPLAGREVQHLERSLTSVQGIEQ